MPAPARLKTLWSRARTHLRAHAEWYWAPALYTLAVYYLYSEVFGGEKGFGWDTIETYWPDLVYFSDQLRAGEWPLWNPFDRGGFPFAADPQPGMYYPLHWLLAGVGAVIGDAPWSMIQFKMLAHHVIAGLCMHAFLRHRKLPRTAALIGGIALIASSPWLIHKASNLLMPMVWTPLIWIAIDRLIAAPSWRRSAALAAALYLAGSAGSPPGFFYVLVMSTLYGAYRFGEHSVERFQRKTLWPHTGHFGLALAGSAIVVLGLLWVSIAPALEMAEYTPRAKRDLAYALSLPLPMWPSLKALLVPTAGKVDIYCGVLVMMLCSCGLLLRPTRDRGTAIFFAGAALLFLAMSFGAELPVLGWFVKHVPGFGLFRISSRYKCLFAPMVAVLAAYGADNLLQTRPRLSRDTWKVIAVAVAAIALVFYLLHANPLEPKLMKRFPGSSTPITLTLLAAGMLIAAALHTRKAAALLLAAMPLLMLSDPERYWHHQQIYIEAKVDHREDMAKIGSLEGVFNHQVRIYDEFFLEQRVGSRLQIRDFRGYPSGDPLDFRRYRDVLHKATSHPELLEAYNVRYVLHGRHHRNGKRSNRLKKDPASQSPDHFTRGEGPVREALHPVPIVAWYAGIVLQDKSKVLDAVLSSEDAQGRRRYAVLEKDAAAAIGPEQLTRLEDAATEAPPSVAGQLQSFEPDRVMVSIHAPSAGIVVLNEVAYPGWKVFVDGQSAASVTANYILRAVVVEAGTHEIEWRYQPEGHGTRSAFYWACLLFLCAALASKLGLLRRLRLRARSSSK